MTKFNENINVEETEAYKMGELMEASANCRKLRLPPDSRTIRHDCRRVEQVARGLGRAARYARSKRFRG